MSKTTYYQCDTCNKVDVFNQPTDDFLCRVEGCIGFLNVIKANQNIAAHNKTIVVLDKDLNTEVANFLGANFEVIEQKEDFYITDNGKTTAIFEKSMYKFIEGNELIG